MITIHNCGTRERQVLDGLKTGTLSLPKSGSPNLGKGREVFQLGVRKKRNAGGEKGKERTKKQSSIGEKGTREEISPLTRGEKDRKAAGTYTSVKEKKEGEVLRGRGLEQEKRGTYNTVKWLIKAKSRGK